MKCQPSRSRRLGWLALLSLPAVLVTLHTLYWQFVSRRLDQDSRAWMAHFNLAGWRIVAGTPIAGGWPLTARLTLPGPAVIGPDGAFWAGERVVLRISLLHPDRLILEIPGEQRMTLGAGEAIDFTAEHQQLDLPLGNHDGPAEYSLAASRISLPPSSRPPFGKSITLLSAAARISHFGQPPLADLPDLAKWAQAWRDRGGRVDLREFALVWGKLDVSGRAVLTLDDRLQPAGEGTAAIAGFAAAIAELAGAGRMPRQTAMLATGVLTLLSGTAGTAEMPMRLQAGRVSVHGIPLLNVPEIFWPDRSLPNR